MSGGGTTTTRLLTKERIEGSLTRRSDGTGLGGQPGGRPAPVLPRGASCHLERRPGDLLDTKTHLACVRRFQPLLKPPRADLFHLSQRERRM